MDAPCEIQGSIHVFRLVNNMCPGKWVHIKLTTFLRKRKERNTCSAPLEYEINDLFY